MLVIRLQRTGRRNLSAYRIVVAERERAVKGKFLEIVGHYLPQRDPVIFRVQNDRVQTWVKKGAIPSDTVARLLKKHGLTDMDPFILRYAKRKPKSAIVNDGAAPEAAPAQVSSDDTTEKAA